MIRKLRSFEKQINQFNKEALAEGLVNQVINIDEHQPEPQFLQHMDELEVRFLFRNDVFEPNSLSFPGKI